MMDLQIDQTGSLSWLLQSGSPGVRFLAMRDLLDLPPDYPDLIAARRQAYLSGPIAEVLAAMDPAGFWAAPGPGYNPKYRASVWSLILLAQLGASAADDERIASACAYLLDHALTPNGQFSMSGAPSGTIDCLQGNLCAALLDLGVTDARLDAAFEWMARSVTGEGVAPASESKAQLRYYASNCGPLFACGGTSGLPCAWGAVKVMLAFSHLPHERRTPLIERAIAQGVEFLLSIDPAQTMYPQASGRPSGNWWKFGFPVFYVTDILQIVEVLAALGFGGDPRLTSAIQCVKEKQDAQGRWMLEYDYTGKTWVDFGPKKQPNPWVTLRALRALKLAGQWKYSG